VTVQRQAHTNVRLKRAQRKIDNLIELRRWSYLMQYRGLGLDYRISDSDFARECGINMSKALEGMRVLSKIIEDAQEHLDDYGTIPESLNYSSNMRDSRK